MLCMYWMGVLFSHKDKHMPRANFQYVYTLRTSSIPKTLNTFIQHMLLWCSGFRGASLEPKYVLYLLFALPPGGVFTSLQPRKHRGGVASNWVTAVASLVACRRTRTTLILKVGPQSPSSGGDRLRVAVEVCEVDAPGACFWTPIVFGLLLKP
jgi:hypothetical protein